MLPAINWYETTKAMARHITPMAVPTKCNNFRRDLSGTPASRQSAMIIDCVQIRGVNRSLKFGTSEKSPSPFRTSVGQPIFSWTIFGQAISYNKVNAFFDLKVYGPQFSNRFCNVRFSLSISDSQRNLACREQFINIICNDKYLDSF